MTSHPSWQDYRRWLGATCVDAAHPAAPAPALAAWSTDSRTIGPGQWFVPITGPSFDGHKFIDAAMKQGAEGFFYVGARKSEIPSALVPKGLAVTDGLEAFQKAASGWRTSLKDLRLVALTGSAGKTTTKEMLSRILHAAGPTFSTEGSFNNEVGVPKTLQQLKPEHRFAALEFGARLPGNIKFLCELGRPDVAAVINVGVAHLGIFGSPENLLNTKLEMFRDSPMNAVLIANADDPRIVKGAKDTGKRFVTFGDAAHADVRVQSSTWLDGGEMDVTLVVRTGWSKESGDVRVRLGVSHQAFPANAAAAAAMALAAGADLASVRIGLQGFAGVKGRYLVHKLGAKVLVDDSYNANPDSMQAGLATLARSFPKERKILVLGDMRELGDASTADHVTAGSRAAALQPALLLAVGAEAGHIAQGARAQGVPVDRIVQFPDVDALLGAKLPFWQKGDVVYVKASNGVKLSRLVDQLLKETP